MWSWNRRGLPPVNYQESDSDLDDYVSPEKSPTELLSPRRPRQAGSPLNQDPTSEYQTDAVLAEANYKLSTTPRYFRNPDRLDADLNVTEEVVGEVVGGPGLVGNEAENEENPVFK